jgi:Transposase DDE domain
MIPEISLLVTLVRLVDRIPTPTPTPAPPTKQRRGRPSFYSDHLFLKALVIMIVKHIHTPYELLCVLEQPTPEMQELRALLSQGGRYPSRRTWERRLASLPDKLPAQIGCLGCHLVALIQPWATCGRAVAADSTVLRARGGVWHQKHREAGVVPHSSIDTEAHWTKSGWHGWVYGWKLHLITVVAQVWIPLAAELTPANADDSAEAAKLMVMGKCDLPADMRYVLGDQHYNTPLLRAVCTLRGWWLVATHRGKRLKTDMGVEVRRIFHKLRSVAMENFNEHFKGIFDGHACVPTKGLVATRRFALGAIFVYQLALLYRFEHLGLRGCDLNVGLKAFLKAA